MEHFAVTQIGNHGYLAVFVLMVLGAACIPLPSEAVMLFGGALAGGLTVKGVHLHLNLVEVGLFGTAGNLVGSWISYAVGRFGGRRLLDRWGRYVLLRPHEVDRAEAFFRRRGDLAVLVGRVIPVVRAFISLPAGVAEMPVIRFSVFTILGSLPWNFGLALAGDLLATHWSAVSSAFTPISVVVVVAVVVWIGWWVRRRLKARSGETPAAP
jgi:membrane protein DedA with SNARE-associated domain